MHRERQGSHAPSECIEKDMVATRLLALLGSWAPKDAWTPDVCIGCPPPDGGPEGRLRVIRTNKGQEAPATIFLPGRCARSPLRCGSTILRADVLKDRQHVSGVKGHLHQGFT